MTATTQRTAVPVTAFVMAAGLLWAASRLVWVTVGSVDGLTAPRTDRLLGATWFGLLTPVALVLVAGAGAFVIASPRVRRALGVVAALLAAMVAVPPVALLTGTSATAQRAAQLAQLPARAHVEQVHVVPGAALVGLAGAVVAFLGGVLATRRGARAPRAPETSGKYDPPAVRRAAATDALDQTATPSQRVLWDALDAGTDPTARRRPQSPEPDVPGGDRRHNSSAQGAAFDAPAPPT